MAVLGPSGRLFASALGQRGSCGAVTVCRFGSCVWGVCPTPHPLPATQLQRTCRALLAQHPLRSGDQKARQPCVGLTDLLGLAGAVGKGPPAGVRGTQGACIRSPMSSSRFPRLRGGFCTGGRGVEESVPWSQRKRSLCFLPPARPLPVDVRRGLRSCAAGEPQLLWAECRPGCPPVHFGLTHLGCGSWVSGSKLAAFAVGTGNAWSSDHPHICRLARPAL